jgi:NAD(P)-dependent dehydrogenase (short-subunit alcohol dehydrogenase family)
MVKTDLRKLNQSRQKGRNQMTDRLKGKNAIITGGSTGIGAAVAELFAKEGASVVLTARREGPLMETVNRINAAGGKALGIPSDVSSEADCKMVFRRAIDFFGDVDIMVNNAGIGDLHLIEETTDEVWENVMGINLNGVFYYCREAAKHFIPRGKGVIVNVSSMNGIRPVAGLAYCASKAAVNSLTQSIALRFTNTNIRCNAVCPGITDTPIIRVNPIDGLNPISEKILKNHVDMTLPFAEPIEQANAVLFLASDESSAITGLILPVDHGSFI